MLPRLASTTLPAVRALCGSPALARASHSSAFVERIRGVGGGSVTLDTSDPLVATITIANKNTRNALSGKMMAELGDAVAALSGGGYASGVAVVLRGAGGTFCSGADLELVRDVLVAPADGLAMCSYMQDLLSRLHALPLVSVAVVEGHAVGGGAELCLATDFRVMAPCAIVHFKHATLALSTGWGGGTRLTQLLGRRAAIRAMCGAAPFSAHEAMVCGLADHVATSKRAHDMSEAAAAFLAPYRAVAAKGTGAVAALRAAKCNVVAAAAGASDVTAGLASERVQFGQLWGSAENKKHVAATIAHIKGQ